MGRQAPGRIGLEHVVLEYEMLRVGPVVGYFAVIVVAHSLRVGGDAVLRIERVVTTLASADETVHLPVIVVAVEGDRIVRAAVIDIVRVVIRAHAPVAQRVGHTPLGLPRCIGIPSAPGKVPK